MKIVHHSNQLGLGGTEKNMQYQLEYLAAAGHECWCLYKEPARPGDSLRAGLIGGVLGPGRVLSYSGAEDFFGKLAAIRPDIFHAHRSGRPNEFPVVRRLKDYARRCVETNIFGGRDPSPVLDLSLCINERMVGALKGLPRRCACLPLAVKSPAHGRDLRGQLGIPAGAFVLGRIGRPDDHIFDPISLRALKLLEEGGHSDILYLVQAPPPAMRRAAAELGLKRVRFLDEPLLADDEVTAFYNTLDVLAHARRDGETFGLNIAEAMVHGRPVVSHRSRIANAHEELVRQCGFFCGADDHREYSQRLLQLYRDRALRAELGERGRRYAGERFTVEVLGPRLEGHYRALLAAEAPRGPGAPANDPCPGESPDIQRGEDGPGYPELIEACAGAFKPGGRVLDCGCGLGGLSGRLAARGYEVTGADISDQLIEEARRKNAGTPGLSFAVEDVAGLSFRDQAFDGVVAALFLEHAADVPGTLSEMCRVLKKGGTLAFTLADFLDPAGQLREVLSREVRPAPRPWQARSRHDALYKFFRLSVLAALKPLGLDSRIHYLPPGPAGGATWLANRYDVRRLLEANGLAVSVVFLGRDAGFLFTAVKPGEREGKCAA